MGSSYEFFEFPKAHLPMQGAKLETECFWEEENLVGGRTNLSQKYWSNWIISPNRGENKKCLKPPPRLWVSKSSSQCSEAFGVLWEEENLSHESHWLFDRFDRHPDHGLWKSLHDLGSIIPYIPETTSFFHCSFLNEVEKMMINKKYRASFSIPVQLWFCLTSYIIIHELQKNVKMNYCNPNIESNIPFAVKSFDATMMHPNLCFTNLDG